MYINIKKDVFLKHYSPVTWMALAIVKTRTLFSSSDSLDNKDFGSDGKRDN